jgi:hypothetical protein
MKKVILSLFLGFSLSLAAFSTQAQNFPGVDRSPLDVSYFPHNLPQSNLRGANLEPLARIIYSRPAKNGREIFGTNLAEYGKVWRLGANENTELQLYSDAIIGGKEVKAGTYSLFAIPEANKWTFILSSDLHNWGAYRYNEANDVLRLEITTQANESVVENFSAMFVGEGKDAKLVFAWDMVKAELPITFK